MASLGCRCSGPGDGRQPARYRARGSAQGDAASTTPTLSTGNLKSKVSSQLQQAKGEVTAFIQTTSPSALERKNSVLKNFSRQRSALPTLKQRAQSAQAATQSAKTARRPR